MELKQIINNAKSVAKRDGYNQIVFAENDGSYTFTRLYSNLKLYNVESVIAIVEVKCINGSASINVIKDKNSINTKVRGYNVLFD